MISREWYKKDLLQLYIYKNIGVVIPAMQPALVPWPSNDSGILKQDRVEF